MKARILMITSILESKQNKHRHCNWCLTQHHVLSDLTPALPTTSKHSARYVDSAKPPCRIADKLFGAARSSQMRIKPTVG